MCIIENLFAPEHNDFIRNKYLAFAPKEIQTNVFQRSLRVEQYCRGIVLSH